MRKTQLYLDKIKRIKLDIEAKKMAANGLVQATNLSYQYGMARSWACIYTGFYCSYKFECR